MKKILRKVASSVFFWKIRHLIQPGWIMKYDEKDSSFILNLVNKKKFSSVLDFGCASGKTIEEILAANPKKNIVYGIDVNFAAVDFCRKKFSRKFSNRFEFSECFNQESINRFLTRYNVSAFDIVLLDRVAYCLSNEELTDLLIEISKISSMIFVDDFDIRTLANDSDYRHRNWREIGRKSTIFLGKFSGKASF